MLGRTFLFLKCCRARKPLHAAWKRVMFLLVCVSRCSSSLASDPARKNTCGKGAGQQWVPESLRPRRAPSRWWGCVSPLCSHWSCPTVGFYSPGMRNAVGGREQCCPFAVPPCHDAQPCPHPHPVVSGTIPGSSPCGSCSSPGPVIPGAPPLPAGRETCQGQALWGAGDLGPQQ